MAKKINKEIPKEVEKKEKHFPNYFTQSSFSCSRNRQPEKINTDTRNIKNR